MDVSLEGQEEQTRDGGELTYFRPYQDVPSMSRPRRPIEINVSKVQFQKTPPLPLRDVMAAPPPRLPQVPSTSSRQQHLRPYMEPKPSTTSLSQVSAVGTTIENLSHRTLVEEQIDKIISSKSLTESNDNHWMPDKLCRECSNCNVKFSIIVRRHHCRVCGRIYCHGCSNHTIPGHLFRSSLKGNVRVCSACEKIFYEVINARQNQNNPSQLMQPIPMSSLASSDHTDDQDTSSLASTASNLYTSSMNRWSDMESHESNVAGSPSASIGIEFDNPTPHRHTSVARKSDLSVVASENDDETILAIAEDEVKLRLQEIWNKFLDKSTGLMSQTHRYRLKNIPNSWTAQEIIEWLLRSNLASSREMAVYIGQAFLQTRCLKVVSSHDQHFKDSKDVILEIGEAGTLVTPTVTFADAPNWFLSDEGEETTVANSRTSIHESKVDLETGLATFRRKRLSAMFSTSPDVTNDSPNSSIPIIIPPVDEEKAQEIDIDNPPSFDKGSTTPGDYIIPPSLTLESIQPSLTSYSILDKEAVNHAMTSVNGLSKASQATKKFEELPVFKEIKRTHMISHEKHFDAILSQQLKAFGLSYHWLDFIKPLIQEACQKISTNVTLNDFMDIRVYCKVKKVAGGHISDCSYVPGVVFTKHVTHKKMDMSLKNPRVLLLKCAFEFQRKENQLSSFDTLLSQECEYLKNLIERVKKFKPSIMFVQKSVSRYALEMLHNHGIVVVVNIKPSVMSRLARCTQGDLILNLDQLYFDVKLGTCGHFYVRTFTVDSGIRKTLMYLDDCDPKLGGVILLKGRARNVLKRVKSVVSLGLQVAHNMNLESSYLSDIFASHSSSEDDHIDDDDYLVTPAITPTQSLYRFSPSMLNDVDSFAAVEDENEDMASALSQSLSACSIDVVEEQQYVVADEAEPVPDENEIKCENDQLLAVENDDNNTDSVDFDKPPMQQLTSAEVFHRILSSHIISTSPNMEFPVPYLQTERGLLADVRYYLPKDIYWSRYFQPKSKSSKSILPSAAVRPCVLTSSNSFSDVSFNHNYKSVSCHPFTNAVFLHSPNSNQFKAALADFRARAFIVDESTDGFFFDSAKRSANIYKVLGEIFKSSHEFEKRAGNLVTDQVMASEIAVVKDTPHSQDVQNDISNSEMNRCDKAMPILATTTEWHDGPDKLDNDSDEGEDDDGNGKRQELDLPQGFPGMSDDVTLPGVSATTEWSFLMEEQILPNADRLDCLDPFNHQFLSLIFSSTCSSETTQKQSYPCVLPCIIPMNYYGRNDISLGEFLNRYCFRSLYVCPSCGVDMEKHQRHFVHGKLEIRISMQQLAASIPGGDRDIFTWSTCLKCAHSTPLIPLAEKTLQFSFAKFLELKFYGTNYFAYNLEEEREDGMMATNICNHSINTCYVQYFCFCDKVAIFEPISIQILEVKIPPREVSIESADSQWHHDYPHEINHLSKLLEGVFHRVIQYLLMYKVELVQDKVQHLIEQAKAMRNTFRSKVKRMKDLSVHSGLFPSITGNGNGSSSTGDGDSSNQNFESLQDSIAELKQSIADTVCCFNIDLENIDNILRESIQRKEMSPRDSGGNTPLLSTVESVTPSTTPHSSPILKQRKSLPKISSKPQSNQSWMSHSTEIPTANSSSSSVLKVKKSHRRQFSDSLALPRPMKPFEEKEEEEESSDGDEDDMEKRRRSMDSHIDDQIRSLSNDDISSHNTTITQTPLASEKLNISTFEIQSEDDDFLIKLRSKDTDDSVKFYSVHTPKKTSAESGEAASDETKTSKGPILKKLNSVPTMSKQEDTDNVTPKSSEKKQFPDKVSALLAKPFQKLPSPFNLTEHHLIRGNLRFSVSVYENEPTSIIAFGLCSREYANELKFLLQDEKKKTTTVETATSLAPPTIVVEGDQLVNNPNGNKTTSLKQIKTKLSDWVNRHTNSPASQSNEEGPLPENVENVEDAFSSENELFASIKWNSLPDSNNSSRFSSSHADRHISLEFTDDTTKFFCKIYYAEEFRKLRETIYPNGEERFIRSLARCVQYKAKGGKSRAFFLKTFEDRLIMKQVQMVEITSFIATAPHYFQHVTQAYKNEKPLVLAKILGAYSIGFRNNKTGRSQRHHVIIMENLLYGHQCTKVFDLKGSMRGRYVESKKFTKGDVLMDENFLEYIYHSPVYVMAHSKGVLMDAILSDTQFLAKNSIMDYSLLIGLDEEKMELIVGIIDFVRPFTFDKLLEMYIKKAGRSVLPTVVYPEMYRKRFVEAMDRYFTPVPDKWTGLGTDVKINS